MEDTYVSQSVTPTNTRIHKVRAFIAKPPKRSAVLRLVAAEQESEAQVPLGEWGMAEAVPELAAEIVELLDQHAAEMQAHITASLAFADDSGKVTKAMVLKRQANHLEAATGSELVPEGINASLTGDARSQAQQAQRHLEAMARVYMAGMAGLLAHSERLVTRQGEMLETLASRLGRAERRADQKDSELEELVDALREARDADKAGNESSPAMERAWKLLEHLAPHLMQQLMAGQRQPRAVEPEAAQ